MARLKSNHKDYIQISAVQMLSAAAIVMVSFVLPAAALQYYQTQPTETQVPYVAAFTSSSANASGGTVAGLSTTIQNKIIDLNLNLDLESDKGMLTIAGVFLIVLGISLVGFLLVTPKSKQNFLVEEVSDFERQVVARWT